MIDFIISCLSFVPCVYRTDPPPASLLVGLSPSMWGFLRTNNTATKADKKKSWTRRRRSVGIKRTGPGGRRIFGKGGRNPSTTRRSLMTGVSDERSGNSME